MQDMPHLNPAHENAGNAPDAWEKIGSGLVIQCVCVNWLNTHHPTEHFIQVVVQLINFFIADNVSIRITE